MRCTADQTITNVAFGMPVGMHPLRPRHNDDTVCSQGMSQINGPQCVSTHIVPCTSKRSGEAAGEAKATDFDAVFFQNIGQQVSADSEHLLTPDRHVANAQAFKP